MLHVAQLVEQSPCKRQAESSILFRSLFKENKINRLKNLETSVRNDVWGVSSSFDIYNCDPATIRSAEKIKQFVLELCDLIDMKRFGETIIVHFGEDEKVAGYSMMQLIETSLISAHFANLSNAVYLDVFSCKAYDVKAVEAFAVKFFGGSHCVTHSTIRY